MMNTTMRSSVPAMAMDLYRSGDTFTVLLDVPGVDPESIDIDVEDRTLTVRAERTAAPADVDWISRERGSGTYARQLTLGYGLDVAKITADYTNGVLTLTIPVAEEAKPRKIQVSTGSGSTSIEASAE